MSAQDATAQAQAKTAEQIFSVLGELKGGAMKLGQALSVFESVLPDDVAGPYRESLTKLQDSAPPDFARAPIAFAILILMLVVATLAIPGYAVLIPLYRLMIGLKLIDTYLGITLIYVSAFLPLTLWLMRSVFDSLPIALEEAAQLDGPLIERAGAAQAALAGPFAECAFRAEHAAPKAAEQHHREQHNGPPQPPEQKLCQQGQAVEDSRFGRR